MQFDRAGAQALMDITQRPELVFVHGQGSWLQDHAGRRYLDFVQGWAVNCLGHSSAPVVAALQAQATQLITPSPAFYNRPSLELAKRLVHASCFDRIFFANSGAEANEGAIKLARKWGQLHKNNAYKIITFEHAFHGRTLATMSASGKPGWDTLFAPQVDGFPKARLNDIDSVKALLDPETVAIMLEPVQGEAGVIPATPEFLQALRALADQHQMLLIVDEVQTGMGRTGTLFAYEQACIAPDIMTLGKGIGAGVPLAALCARESVACFAHGDQGGTYNGNPLMTAVGVAVFDTLSAPGFLGAVQARAAQLSQGLTRIAQQWHMPGERGLGLLRALDVGQPDAGEIVARARDWPGEGLLLNAPRPNLLRFMPALNVTADDVDAMLARLGEVIAAVRAA